MSTTIIMTRSRDGGVAVEVEAQQRVLCDDVARRMSAVALLLGGQLKGMNVPDGRSSPPPIPDMKRVKA